MNRHQRAKKIEQETGISIEVKTDGSYRVGHTTDVTTLKAAQRVAREIAAQKRQKNPRPTMFVLLARKKGGPLLKFAAGLRFSTTGRAVMFASKQDALSTGRALRAQFPVLRQYKMVVR